MGYLIIICCIQTRGKIKHVQRRWHGAAVFPSLVALGGVLELEVIGLCI